MFQKVSLAFRRGFSFFVFLSAFGKRFLSVSKQTSAGFSHVREDFHIRLLIGDKGRYGNPFSLVMLRLRRCLLVSQCGVAR